MSWQHVHGLCASSFKYVYVHILHIKSYILHLFCSTPGRTCVGIPYGTTRDSAPLAPALGVQEWAAADCNCDRIVGFNEFVRSPWQGWPQGNWRGVAADASISTWNYGTPSGAAGISQLHGRLEQSCYKIQGCTNIFWWI